MSPVIQAENDTEVLVCVMTSGIEIVLEIGKDVETPDWEKTVALYLPNYHTKKRMYLFTRHLVLCDRISSAEYDRNLAEAQARKGMGQIAIPKMSIPGRNH